ncbi:MAG: ATP synthase subunit I [Thermodesulfobacteriota bacterium]|nr:ATP synthase subunit I [Thermodesulfobacteriota bacterium]
MNGRIERELIIKLNLTGWIIFAALSLVSLYFFSLEVIAGVITGGLLVTVNLQLLRRVAVRALRPGARVALKNILVKYYLRFLATALIIFFLMYLHLVDELGLLLGLSVFVMSIYFVLMSLMGKFLYKKITKEAV